MLSVRQSDVRIVARDLAEYLYDLPAPDAPGKEPDSEEVPFWTDLARLGTVRLPFFGRQEHYPEIDWKPFELAAQEHGRAVSWSDWLSRGIWFSLPAPQGERSSACFALIPTDGGWILTSSRREFYITDPEEVFELTVDLLERWPEEPVPGQHFRRIAIYETWRRRFGLIDLDEHTRQTDLEEVNAVARQRSGWRTLDRSEDEVAWEAWRKFRVPEPSCVWDVAGLWLAPKEAQQRLEDDLTGKSQLALRKCTSPG